MICDILGILAACRSDYCQCGIGCYLFDLLLIFVGKAAVILCRLDAVPVIEDRLCELSLFRYHICRLDERSELLGIGGSRKLADLILQFIRESLARIPEDRIDRLLRDLLVLLGELVYRSVVFEDLFRAVRQKSQVGYCR